MNINVSNINNFFNVATRIKAIEEGLLLDVTTTAEKVGFTVSVAISRKAWNQTIESGSSRQNLTEQEKESRLNVMLNELFSHIKTMSIVLVNPPTTNTFSFPIAPISATPSLGRRKRSKELKLKSISGVGELGTSAITIVLPCEDDQND